MRFNKITPLILAIITAVLFVLLIAGMASGNLGLVIVSLTLLGIGTTGLIYFIGFILYKSGLDLIDLITDTRNNDINDKLDKIIENQNRSQKSWKDDEKRYKSWKDDKK